jgi:hypothetical protein
MNMPRGLFFDPKRDRYRVRLYRGHAVVHLSYHKNLDDALREYHRVSESRPEIKPGPGSLAPEALFNYLAA